MPLPPSSAGRAAETCAANPSPPPSASLTMRSAASSSVPVAAPSRRGAERVQPELANRSKCLTRSMYQKQPPVVKGPPHSTLRRRRPPEAATTSRNHRQPRERPCPPPKPPCGLANPLEFDAISPSTAIHRHPWPRDHFPHGRRRVRCFPQSWHVPRGPDGARSSKTAVCGSLERNRARRQSKMIFAALTLSGCSLSSPCVSLNGDVHRLICHPVIEPAPADHRRTATDPLFEK